MQLILAMAVLAAGIRLTIGTRFVQIRKLGAAFKGLVTPYAQAKGERGLTPLEALSTALSGTMGVGTVLAVTTALSLGGAGALGWLWLGGFFAMAVKYGEVYLCVKHRAQGAHGEPPKGGAMFVLRDTLRKPWLANVYAALIVALGLFSMGCMTQSAALKAVLTLGFGLDGAPAGFTVLALLMPLVFLGTKRLGRFCAVCFPAVAGLYALSCVGCCLAAKLPLGQILADVFMGMFTFEAALPGAGAAAFIYGISRGLFSNEAGLGTSAMAHAGAKVVSPHAQALTGMAEVCLNTFGVVTLTALVVLTSGVPLQGSDGAMLAARAFGAYLGVRGEVLVMVMLGFFALTTMPVWLEYGLRALAFLLKRTEKTLRLPYTLLYLICAFVGALAEPTLLWHGADLLNLTAALPNLYMLLRLRGEIFASAHERT